MTPDIWPFKTQKEYDTFNSHLKGDNRNLRESAIRSWIEAKLFHTKNSPVIHLLNSPNEPKGQP